MGYLDGKLSSVAVSVSVVLPALDALAISVSALNTVLNQIMISVANIDLNAPTQDTANNSLQRDVIGSKIDTVSGNSLYSFSVLADKSIFPNIGIQVWPDLGIMVSITPGGTAWATSTVFVQIIASGTIGSPFVLDYAVIDGAYSDEAYQLDLYSGTSGAETLIATAVWSINGIYQQAPIKTPVLAAGARVSAKFASSAPAFGYASYFKVGYHLIS